jgi:SAM-dependent methyltransferase
MKHKQADLDHMGSTYRPGIGLAKGKRERWPQVIADEIKVGSGPIIPSLLYVTLSPKEAGRVLDFGCGVGASNGAIHVQALRKLGYSIVGYEWTPPDQDGSERACMFDEMVAARFIDPQALSKTYGTVLANNVINVQPDRKALTATMVEIKRAMGPKTLLLINLPSSPRACWPKGAAGETAAGRMLEKNFSDVTEVAKGIWICEGPRR